MMNPVNYASAIASEGSNQKVPEPAAQKLNGTLNRKRDIVRNLGR